MNAKASSKSAKVELAVQLAVDDGPAVGQAVSGMRSCLLCR